MNAVGDDAPVSLFQPGEELNGLGNFVLRRALWAVGGLAGSRFTAEPAEMVPGRELFNRGANSGGVDRVEFVGQMAALAARLVLETVTLTLPLDRVQSTSGRSSI